MNHLGTQAEWIERARAVFPAAGFGNFDADLVLREGKGARVWDQDGREYVDYLIASGPMLLGHAHPEVEAEVLAQIPKGTTFFTSNAPGIALAEEICRAVPCAESLRYLCTGGEADMYAIRLARAFTGRDKILKFEGGYHGMSAEAQMSLAPAEPAAWPVPVPDSAGIPAAVRDQVWIAPFNDAAWLGSFMAAHGHEIAGLILEPFQRFIPPEPGFLEAARRESEKHGSLLIFDEVVTGFRFAYGGAQDYYGVVPDLCTLGKVIGGGFPLAAVAGRNDIMAHFDRQKIGAEGWLMQVGTLSGNPVAAAAGLKTLEILRRPGAYEHLFRTGKHVMALFQKHLGAQNIAHRLVGEPPLFDAVLTDRPVRNFRDAQTVDRARYQRLMSVLRREGILKPPGKVYCSLALGEAELQRTDAALEKAAAEIAAMA